jgi:hypothetical protein
VGLWFRFQVVIRGGAILVGGAVMVAGLFAMLMAARNAREARMLGGVAAALWLVCVLLLIRQW